MDRDRRDAERRWATGNPNETREDRLVGLQAFATALERIRRKQHRKLMRRIKKSFKDPRRHPNNPWVLITYRKITYAYGARSKTLHAFTDCMTWTVVHRY